MKVAFVTRSLAGGGAERVVSVLANSFCQSENVEQVSVISVIEDKVTYPISDEVIYYANDTQYMRKIKRVVQRYKFLKDVLKRIKPDVVISFCTQINIYSIFAMQKLPGSLIISERNDPNNDPVQSYVRKFRNLIYRLCNAAVFQTPDAALYFKKIVKGPTTVILNPIESDLPARFEGKREKRIVSVARLTDVKNHQMLIKAFNTILKRHSDYILEIYGEGPEQEKLQKLIDSLQLQNKVFLRGFCTNVHERIRAAMCFVLPSNYEGISNSMIEALGLGIPTICTDCPIGGARIIIENNVNGVLIPVGDQKALEKALIKVIENEDFRERVSLKAIEVNKRLSAKNISREWIKFVNIVLSTKK